MSRRSSLIRRYRSVLLALFVISVGLGYLAINIWPGVVPAIIAGLSFEVAAFICYVDLARQLHISIPGDPSAKISSSLRVRRLADYTNYLWEFLIVAFTLSPFILLFSFYPALPEKLPVHFNAAGEADRWARKSIGAVFFLPSLAFYLQCVFLLFKYDLVHSKMAVPAKRADELLEYKERLLATNVNLTDLVRVSLSFLFGGLTLLVISKVSGGETAYLLPAAQVGIWGGAAVLFIGLAYFFWRIVQIKRQVEAVSGGEAGLRSIDQAYWQNGGLTYSNPDDASLMVEKLVGIGYTYNMANPGVYRRLAVLGGVPVFIVWSLLYLI